MISPSRFAGFALACATLVLGACTQVPTRQAEIAVSAADQPFAIDGRLSARRGSEGAAANFAWNHEVGRDRIDFASPFGQVYARIDGTAEQIRVERPGGATDAYPDWNSLTLTLLSAAPRAQAQRLPLNAMRKVGCWSCGNRRGRSCTPIRTTRRRRCRRAWCSGVRTPCPSRFASSSIVGTMRRRCPDCGTIGRS